MSLSAPPATGPLLKILCFDGGDVRGLSSLLILERIMEDIQKSEGLSDAPRPCDRFDFIGGTGTGGIIAIMLGRLGMSISQSIKAFKSLANTAFVQGSTSSTRPPSTLLTKKLEIAIKQMIRTNCNDTQRLEQRKSGSSINESDTRPHEDMLFVDERGTKTAVLAITKANVETLPTLLTTYDTSERFQGCRVWEVARATSAAVTFFDSIKLGRDNIEFIDASYGYNNPCEILITEAEKQFPGKETIILSIGTGLGNAIEIKDSNSHVLEALSQMATSSKRTDLQLKQKYGSTGGYYRFNVETGLEEPTIPDYREYSDIPSISAHTMNYCRENSSAFGQFVTALTTSSVSQPRIDHSDKDKECLSHLYVCNPRTEKKDIEGRKGGLLKECYQWIVKREDFQQFLNENESRILWIKGHPGKGKTMLLCGIIDELIPRRIPLSYFFCQAANDKLNTATSVLRGLIYDLAHHNPQLIRHVRKKYDVAGKTLFSNSSAWHDLREILTNMLNDPSLRNVILIVDALDECDTQQEELIEFISKPSPAKWIVSSRDWSGIEDMLNDAEQKVKIDLEITQESISAAVESYIKLKVDHIVQNKKYDDSTKMDILSYLMENSNGTFLWVALVCQKLSKPLGRRWHVLDTLRSFPAGLDLLYKRMLKYIFESSDAQRFKDILAKVLVAYRPITLEELHVFVRGLEDLSKEEVDELIASCGSFLTLHNNVISFVHQSAKDYLLKEAQDDILPSGISYQHQEVFTQSLNILQTKLNRDIYNLRAPGCLIDQALPPKPNPLDGLGYSCVFWVNHLCKSSENEIVGQCDEILAFFNKSYLQWLEALSLLRSISIVGGAMEKLRCYLVSDFVIMREDSVNQYFNNMSQKKAPQDLQDIVKDAHRFFFYHGGVIEIAPLQVYVAALIFSPTNSLIRQKYRHEEPDWIKLKPRVEENWGPCLRTLEGHRDSVELVVLSNDGKRLASGSGDNTVKIWDANSGACLQTLEGHSGWVESLVFSSDGKQLASGSYDKTIKIWEIDSGTYLQTLQRRHCPPVVLSNDGLKLALKSDDNTVEIRNADSGASLQTFKGHSDRVESVVFSNDGQWLASGSRDKTVKIWDATSGECRRTLKGHQQPVTSVAFSHDGRRLASGSSDKTIKIWDETSSACQQTLWGHNNCVTSVVFSEDGERLASGSWDNTIKIWDTTSDSCLQYLDRHDRSVTSLVFSNDGQRLASLSVDWVVKIWDATSGECLQTLKDDPSSQHLQSFEQPETPLVFSNDGLRLAAGSDDNTVKIWDVSSGECLKTLKGHRDSVVSVVFSNDGQRLASISDDSTAKIWDVSSGVCLQTLDDYDSWPTLVAFSNDRQRLASASNDNKVKIWDVNSGACLSVIKGHGDTVTSLVFSDDGHQLRSRSDDKTVRIWDTTSSESPQAIQDRHSDVVSVAASDGQRPASGFSVDQASLPHTGSHSYSISSDKVWVMEGQRRVLWLPPSCRPVKSAVAQNRLGINTASNRIIIMQFDPISQQD